MQDGLIEVALRGHREACIDDGDSYERSIYLVDPWMKREVVKGSRGEVNTPNWHGCALNFDLMVLKLRRLTVCLSLRMMSPVCGFRDALVRDLLETISACVSTCHSRQDQTKLEHDSLLRPN